MTAAVSISDEGVFERTDEQAVSYDEAGDLMMQPATSVLARRDRQSCRPAGVSTAAIDVPGLHDKAMTQVDARVEMSLKLRDDPADCAVFAETLLRDQPTATAADVLEYLRADVETVVKQLATQFDARQLTTMEPDAPTQRISEALKLPLFRLGLASTHAPKVTFSSSELAERDAEANAAAVREQFEKKSVGLTHQLRALSEGLPGVSYNSLLNRLPIDDQLDALRAWYAEQVASAPPAIVWALGESSLVRLQDGVDLEELHFGTELGPARKLLAVTRGDATTLYVGCRFGVHRVTDDGDVDLVFDARERVGHSRYGFSGLAYDPERRLVWATHRDVGMAIVHEDTGSELWHFENDLSRPSAVSLVGDVGYVGGRDKLYRVEPGSDPELLADRDIVYLKSFYADGNVALRTGEGSTHRHDLRDPDNVTTAACPGPLAVGGTIPFGNTVRLIGNCGQAFYMGFATTDDQHLPMRLPYRIAELAASATCIAAVNDTRDRVLTASPVDDEFHHERYLMDTLRSPIADVAVSGMETRYRKTPLKA